ncbi:hypothetical protein VFPBJ_08944 [Purpureocillium lilacinum]|uniref:Uncharacterized protein n=1 Tax=Purpureocillium lilacinum TaxID=33203 RepID=A0A179GFG4_PURLI|nr:hypothetical protein VFPBJ_08944 [Purpureocillium lilacinum]
MALPRSRPGRVAVDSSVGFGEPGLGPGTHQGSAVPESDPWMRALAVEAAALEGSGTRRSTHSRVDIGTTWKSMGLGPLVRAVSLEFLRIVPAMASCPVRGTE